jgi:hypothetical protein
MIVSKEKILELRKEMIEQYKKEVEAHKAEYKNQYHGAASDDGRSYPSCGQVCDCGFLSYIPSTYAKHFYSKEHKQYNSDEKKKQYKKYLF